MSLRIFNEENESVWLENIAQGHRVMVSDDRGEEIVVKVDGRGVDTVFESEGRMMGGGYVLSECDLKLLSPDTLNKVQLARYKKELGSLGGSN